MPPSPFFSITISSRLRPSWRCTEEQVSSDTSLQVLLLTVPLETAVHLRILLSLNPDINMTTDPISLMTGDLDETVSVPNTLTPSPEQRRVWQVLAKAGSAGTNHTLPRNSVDWKVLPGRLVWITSHVKDAPSSLSV